MKNLVVTTKADTDLDLFRPYCDIFLLNNFKQYYSDIQTQKYDTVYFRSQFAKPSNWPNAFENEINQIARSQESHNAYFLDSTKTVNEILHFEDKWNQYQRFGLFMPKTWLFNDSPKNEFMIYKKRVSGRAAGVEFSAEKVKDPENWIAQERMDILREIRIYVICGEVCTLGSVRSSKTESQKIKVKDVIKLTDQLISFTEKVVSLAPEQDFLGVDIAETKEGLKLIEVNRTPAFSTYYKMSGVNLAEELYNKLSSKLDNNH